VPAQGDEGRRGGERAQGNATRTVSAHTTWTLTCTSESTGGVWMGGGGGAAPDAVGGVCVCGGGGYS
jgi:hypothetical protein